MVACEDRADRLLQNEGELLEAHSPMMAEFNNLTVRLGELCQGFAEQVVLVLLLGSPSGVVGW